MGNCNCFDSQSDNVQHLRDSDASQRADVNNGVRGRGERETSLNEAADAAESTDILPPLNVDHKKPDPLSIPTTPSTKSKQTYKFYCPICFEYFKEILETNCCKNYVCGGCAADLIQRTFTHNPPANHMIMQQNPATNLIDFEKHPKSVVCPILLSTLRLAICYSRLFQGKKVCLSSHLIS